MKTIGLIGGTSWVSTVEYYRVINKQINKRLGGLNSAKILLYSQNQEEHKPPSDEAGWIEQAGFLIGISRQLEDAGAECILLCANTPHMIADKLQLGIHVPLIHIADATAREILKFGLKRVALLGTKVTMEQSFYRDRLAKFGIAALTPDQGERDFIDTTIFSELDKEIFKDETRKKYLAIIERLKGDGAEGVIFGCTEIPLLIKQSDCTIPAFDTTTIHALAAAEFALGD
ncbi:MAG TPA: aspartate/glutamate racemase family protein [Candidatus Kryptonia bacterium]